MRPDADTYFLQMARLVATRSTCYRRAVGCVLVNELNHVLATGYNGVARGQPHCNEPTRLAGQGGQHYPHLCGGARAASGRQLDRCEAIHAEQNALLQCHNVQEIRAAYVTTTPCVHCTKLLLNTSCQVIAAPLGEVYDPAALALWQRAGREVLFVQLG